MTDKWETRRTLVARAQDPNDQQAWNDFTAHYKPFINRTLNFINVNPAENDDIIQETLIAIWKQIKTFEFKDHPGGFRRWLSTVIRHRAIDHIRKNSTYDEKATVAGREKAIAQEISQSELKTKIEREWERYITQTALANIKNYFTEIAVQTFELSLQGKKAHEISEQLGIKQDSVRTLKNRVKLRVVKEIKRLRTELEF